MKLDYQRKIQYLNDVIKQQENIIEKLQKEKYHPSQKNSTRRTVQTTNDANLGTHNTETKNS